MSDRDDASEMLRLNTGIPATAADAQQPLGVAAGDLAGFPNGRRPGDDVTDIALRAVMGAFCHDLPIGADGAPANLGLCGDADPATVPFVGTPVGPASQAASKSSVRVSPTGRAWQASVKPASVSQACNE